MLWLVHRLHVNHNNSCGIIILYGVDHVHMHACIIYIACAYSKVSVVSIEEGSTAYVNNNNDSFVST